MVLVQKRMCTFMNDEFSSEEELYERVLPALRAKEIELERVGYSYINKIDVWNYLVEKKWKYGRGLMLSDIVSDIMNVSCSDIDSYIKEKIKSSKRTQYFVDMI